MIALPHFFLLFASFGPADLQTAGQQALDRHDYAKAGQIFEQLVASDPHDYSALFNLALAESALKQDEKAIDHYKQVLAEKPGLYEAQLNLGIVELRQHRPADALPLLESAAKERPSEAQPKRYLALAELETGQELASEGKLDDAAAHYRRAAERDPRLNSHLLELAAKFAQAKRPNDALPLLAQFPDDPAARAEAGRLDLELNRPADAVAQYEAAVQGAPTPANRLALASAYLKNNQPERAAPLLAQAVAAAPNDYDLRMALGRIYRDKRQFPAAAEQFVVAARLKPDSANAWNEAASVLVMAGQYPQALGALDQVRDLHDEIPADFYYRAMILDKMHQVKPALASYQRFLAVSQGKFPDQEFIARQRSRILQKEASR